MKTTRPYRMTARQETVDATRRRILDAVGAIAYERLEFEPTLDAVAERAGVSVRTVLRHFATRDALLDAELASARAEIEAERRPPETDVDSALEVLVDHYELRGDFVLAMLAREGSDPRVARITGPGKRMHRDWVGAVFADRLPGEAGRRAELVDLLVVATDVYAWKLLRRDRGLPAATVRQRMRTMTDALLRHPDREGPPPCPPH